MTSEDRIARAAFWLALGLFLLALPRPDSPREPCRAPRRVEAAPGQISQVRCDGEGPALAGPARLLFGLHLDPNRADAEALEVLPGIGPARAAAIVAERERRPFGRVRDLLRVPGIGPVTLRRIEPWLAVGEARLQQNR